ncbi:hypothetical protein E9531_00990 [Lampropedia puyangensis]|uniref:Uncharacterized protein n=1 Tax=Lampropedia puyangensis TaxID=1330072 RepID=A0A4S8FH66_9BURK|nr:hypothetical protein [Lampropedia puyangensis]THU05162.1 hypothetical protein E9531_00990 [Lampropedia puyangensis]
MKRSALFTAFLSALMLVGIDVYLWWDRTAAMAPVGWSRLFFSLVLQSVGVLGIVVLTLPKQSRLRMFLEDTYKALPWLMAVGGVLLGTGLAVGALHYSDCTRWNFNGGVVCH